MSSKYVFGDMPHPWEDNQQHKLIDVLLIVISLTSRGNCGYAGPASLSRGAVKAVRCGSVSRLRIGLRFSERLILLIVSGVRSASCTV